MLRILYLTVFDKSRIGFTDCTYFAYKALTTLHFPSIIAGYPDFFGFDYRKVI